MDCGPSCLAMIAGYYGRHLDRAQLRHLCSLGKEGVSLLGMSEAAETIGFRTACSRFSFEMLMVDVPLPCIVHWDQNHFVVLYKIRKCQSNRYSIYVADPGKGLLIYTQE